MAVVELIEREREFQRRRISGGEIETLRVGEKCPGGRSLPCRHDRSTVGSTATAGTEVARRVRRSKRIATFLVN